MVRNGKTKQHRQIRCSGVFRSVPVFRRSGVPVFRGVPVFLVLVHAVAYKLSPMVTCSLTRAICLELLPNQRAEGVIRSLKRFIARRGRPRKIYSDNGSSFTAAAAKWLSKVMKSEQLQNQLAHQGIKWQYNVSHAPWWGGHFERLVGLV